MNKRTIITILLALVAIVGQAQLMEQQEKSGVYSNYAESRQKKTEGQLMEQREQSGVYSNYAE